LATCRPSSPCRPIVGDHFTGAWFNLPALIILLIATYILVIGSWRERAETNNVMVAIKIAAPF